MHYKFFRFLTVLIFIPFSILLSIDYTNDIQNCCNNDFFNYISKDSIQILLQKQKTWIKSRSESDTAFFGPAIIKQSKITNKGTALEQYDLILKLWLAESSKEEMKQLVSFYQNIFKACIEDSNSGNDTQFLRSILIRSFISNNCLFGIDFRFSHLDSAIFTRNSITFSKFENTQFYYTNMKKNLIFGCDFNNSNFKNARLDSCLLSVSFFRNCDFTNSNLSFSGLFISDFEGSIMKNTNLTDASLRGANLKDVLFEPTSLPPIINIAYAKNLDKLKYDLNPTKLIELRKGFKQKGFLTQSNEVNCALRRHNQKWYQKIAFDWTICYGTNMIKPWMMLFLLVICSTATYFIFTVMSNRFKSCIIVSERRMNLSGTTSIRPESYDERKVYRIHRKTPEIYIRSDTLFSKLLPNKYKLYYARLFGWALLASLASTLNIGLKRLTENKGVFLLFGSDVKVEFHGIVRIISGIQTFISAYLVFLWLACLFTNPFYY